MRGASLAKKDELQGRDGQVVEPGVGLPVVEGEIGLIVTCERFGIAKLQEGRRHVVDKPADFCILAGDFPVVALADLDLGCGARSKVDAFFAMLVTPRQKGL